VTTPFDLRAPLPKGRIVIEASAGTGKTFAVAGLVTRALVEGGLAPESLLVTTFTKAAASELRHRIRANLVSAVHLLDGTRAPTDTNAVEQALLDTDTEGRATRLVNARLAVADFESISISTIHSLCQRILRLAGEDVQLSDDGGGVDGLLDEVINDMVIHEAARGNTGLNTKRLQEIAEVKLNNPTSELYVHEGAAPEVEDARDLVERVVADVHRRQAHRLSFDALLARAHRAVVHGDDALRAQLRERFTLAVVDEAQDTDPLQWQLLQALFPAAETDRTLVIVGDPKQSIYAFRGADVDGYVASRAEQAQLRSLSTNFRSDQPLLDQLNALFGDKAFANGVSYVPVSAPPHRQASQVTDGHPIVELLVPHEPTPRIIAEAAAWRVAQAIAATRYKARDIAVLVGTRQEGAAVAAALAEFGVPAVTSGTASVAKSLAATELRALFRALEDAFNPKVVRRAALGWFGDLTPADLVTEDTDRLLPFQERLPERRALLREAGMAALMEQLLSDPLVLERMAGTGQLARQLTDLDHLTELLHEASGGASTDPASLLATLRQLTELDEKSELVTRRIETDAETVQIMTIHAAKGLQFPFVVVAKQWSDGNWHLTNRVPHGRLDPARDGQRCIDCAYYLSSKEVSDDSKQAFLATLQAEDDRLFYVAVTRAERELVVVVPLNEKRSTMAPLRCFGVPLNTSAASALRDALAERMAGFGNRFAVTSTDELFAGAPPVVPRVSTTPVGGLQIAPAPALVRAPFRFWSFTVASSRKARVALTDTRGGEDEFGADDTGGHAAADVAAPAGVLGPLPAGADFGTILHSLFEHLDFAAPDLPTALAPLLTRWASVPSLLPHHDALRQGLIDALHTPLGDAAPLDFRLADVSRTQRLDELRFDLALPDATPVPVARIGALLLERLASDDVLRPYAARLAAGALPAALQGMLNGSIDLVLRHPHRGEPYLIVDYKSNRLPAYDAATLLESMVEHHYPLQGLFYSVALYRYLRWRTGQADPSPQLGGFAYLFVRGMTGAESARDAAGRRAGVFHWQAPPGLVAALSDLLAPETAS